MHVLVLVVIGALLLVFFPNTASKAAAAVLLLSPSKNVDRGRRRLFIGNNDAVAIAVDVSSSSIIIG